MQRLSSGFKNGRRNFMAVIVTVLSAGFLYVSFDAVPAGENLATRRSPLQTSEDTSLVPLPKNIAITSLPDDVEKQPADDQMTPVADGGKLSSRETIEYCLFLLQDGARRMEQLDDYTVVFHKHERINGDLLDPQVIEMKIQHRPHFAVYMKWLEGERGRQLLYSDAYEDGCMSIKFGGFKRLLPALRVDPGCSQAKAESRYPVTQAGVLNMIHKLVAHRQDDLEKHRGVSCVRMPDQDVQGRTCFCFQLAYDSPQDHSEYRKHLLMIDTELHIPVVVRNFTWSADAGDLTPEELDRKTLIENYSFTDLNITRKLAAADFSRDNPRYRM